MIFTNKFVLIDINNGLFHSFIADEELGGHDGMKQYVVSKEFKKLNIGLALDEGLASPTEVMPVYYGERNVFWVRFHCTGMLEYTLKNVNEDISKSSR